MTSIVVDGSFENVFANQLQAQSAIVSGGITSDTLTATNAVVSGTVTAGNVTTSGTLRVGSTGTTVGTIKRGTTTVNITSPILADSNTSVNITFPTPFASTPAVVYSLNGGTLIPNQSFLFLGTSTPSTTGFSLNIRNVASTDTGTGTLIISWVAWV